MSVDNREARGESGGEDAWETIAEHRDLLEEIVEDDIDAFTEYAQNLLDALDEREGGDA